MATMIDLLKRSLAINFVSFDLLFSLATGHRIGHEEIHVSAWPCFLLKQTPTHDEREMLVQLEDKLMDQL